MCCDLTTERGVRRATSALGVATFLFGLAPAVAPGYFARLVGIASAETHPATLSVIRSVGIRDAVMGIWRKWLDRRSQRARMSWERMTKLLERYPLPRPRLRGPVA